MGLSSGEAGIVTPGTHVAPFCAVGLASCIRNDSLDSKPTLHRPLSIADSSDTGVLASWEEELQQQLRIQVLRHRVLADACSKYQLDLRMKVPRKSHLTRLLVEDRSKVLYCEVPKVGCSNWRRVLIVLAGKATSALAIPHYEAHKNLQHLHKYNPEGITERLKYYTKVLFVRDPFERLVSAFRDKFENPNGLFHKGYGRAIISRYRTNASSSALKTGDGVTFTEFVQYLLDPQRPLGLNSHWKPISMLCHPCLLHYDFIGKSKNMTREANFLLRSIGAPPDLRYPNYKDRNPQDKRTCPSIMKKYFSQLNATERQGVYDFYHLDYLLFNYSKPLPDLL
ncbi:carbohydrate sulfotransferase 8-like [Halichoeres trimaculatus]|uniref:carbohydrate sulfotransferase 8-like n=1 Tax=Halichoeres trimaculatus TaxID=147232 RepID=UPI003D9E299A